MKRVGASAGQMLRDWGIPQQLSGGAGEAFFQNKDEDSQLERKGTGQRTRASANGSLYLLVEVGGLLLFTPVNYHFPLLELIYE